MADGMSQAEARDQAASQVDDSEALKLAVATRLRNGQDADSALKAARLSVQQDVSPR